MYYVMLRLIRDSLYPYGEALGVGSLLHYGFTLELRFLVLLATIEVIESEYLYGIRIIYEKLLG